MRQATYRGRVVQRVSRFPEQYHDFGWKYGDLHHYYNGSFFTQISCIDPEEMQTNTFDVVANSVSECTGLSLAPDVLLYEGDIFKYSHHPGFLLPDFIGHVVWIEKSACFGYLRHDNLRITPFTAHDELKEDFLNYCEIIGNFYDNEDMIPKVKRKDSLDTLPF